MISTAIFMGGSLVCALAHSSTTLIAGRVVQGLGGGGSTVLITIIIGDLFPLAERAKYYGLTGIVFGIASATTNIASFTVACLHSFIFISYDFFLPLYFQVILGFKPIISGVTLFALILPMSFVTLLGGYIVRKTGNFKILITIGAGLMTLGTGLFIDLSQSIQWAKIILFQFIAGMGSGVLFQNPMIALQSHVHHRDLTATMSAYTFLRSLFTSISIVVGTVLIQRTVGGGNLTSVSDDEGSRTTDKQDYMDGLRIMWAFYTSLAGLTFLVSFLIKPKQIKKTDHVESGSN
ncbi:hypothetical protein CEP52_011273 [Fusarium oligoseptatum]|uniref:Major facilitator superfamily (MFS) profile domain-containing protein n=1 Tax=Fusarium oligoseptatum TaxID=2604345 RepID=A0A428T429_9HYPO|nr:hypothetical protein CEP52_011273 [Fusarium oligoseptatum]